MKGGFGGLSRPCSKAMREVMHPAGSLTHRGHTAPATANNP
jgi:hypothetical protein